MMFFADNRHAYVTLEQPMNSLPYAMANITTSLELIQARPTIIWMGGWGASTQKPLTWYTTFPPSATEALVKSQD
jgi:hypothetical protein